MSDIKIPVEIRKKYIANIESTSQVHERKLAKEIISYKGLTDVNAKILEKKEIARNKLTEMRLWIKEINPNYDPYSPYGNNCGTCALVVHNKLKGYTDMVAGRINIAPQDADMEELTGLRCIYMHPLEIEQILKMRGPGSELIVGINRREGAGHWFNVFYDGDKIYTVDGQCGEILDWPYDYGNVSAWCALI